MRILLLDSSRGYPSLFGQEILNQILKDHRSDIIGIITEIEKTGRKRYLFKRLMKKLKARRSLFLIDLFYKCLSILLFKKINWTYSENENKICYKKKYSLDVSYFNEINSKAVEEFIILNKIDLAFHIGGKILKNNILNAPKIGVIGYHHGDIRKYRGPFQCFWELYYREKSIGVTIQILRSHLDTGPIVLLEEYAIPKKTNLKDLQKKSNWDSVFMGTKAISVLKNHRGNVINNYQIGIYRGYPNVFQVLKLMIRGQV